jgi:Tfp pilus assembly protein PilF
MLNSLLRALRDAMRGRRASSTVASAVDAEAAAWAAADADFSAGRLDRARAGYESLVRRHPDRAEALFRLGVIYGSSGLLDEAEAVLARAEHIEPHSPDIRNARANVAWLRSDWAEAEQRFQAALKLAPRNATLWANYGLCLHDAGRLPEAAGAVEQALELDATHADALVNAALVQLDLGDIEAAGRYLRRALEVAPAFPEAHVLQAQCLLRHGRYAEGWPEYEWRFRCADARFRESPSLAHWDGTPDRARRVLVFAEQGLGDQIMFASCLAELNARAVHSEIECDARLVGLFTRSFPQMRVHAQRPDLARPWAEAAAPDAACQIHLGSLPKLFRNDARQFPQSAGYLKPDPLKVRAWADRLAGLGRGLKVGIAWRGGVPRTRQAMRSIPLAQWLPLLHAPKACFVSLQHGDCEAELTEFSHRERVDIACWPQAVEDLDEMAALVSALDLVITVCGTVVHLAGALGKPAWVLVPTCPEWRYGDAGDTMPWYASVRMFRQETPGNWQVPMQEIVRQLAQAAQPSRR